MPGPGDISTCVVLINDADVMCRVQCMRVHQIPTLGV